MKLTVSEFLLQQILVFQCHLQLVEDNLCIQSEKYLGLFLLSINEVRGSGIAKDFLFTYSVCNVSLHGLLT